MTDDKAREARYAEAMHRACCAGPDWQVCSADGNLAWDRFAEAAMAVADGEVEAATRELRAEVERLREAYDGMHIAGRDQFDRAEKAEAERDQLRAAIEAWADEAPSGTAGLDLLRQIVSARVGAGSVPLPVADRQADPAADTQPEGAGDATPSGDFLLPWQVANWAECCGVCIEGKHKYVHPRHFDPLWQPGDPCPCCHGDHRAVRLTADPLRGPTPTAGSKVEGSEIPSPETSEAGSSDTAPEVDCYCPDDHASWCPNLPPADAAPESREGR